MAIPLLVGTALSALHGGGLLLIWALSIKEVAKLQDQIYQLQVQLSESQEREKKLLNKLINSERICHNLFK